MKAVKFIAAAVASTVLAGTAFNANAAAVNYGTLAANTVVYTDIIENSFTDAVPLYGDGNPAAPFNPFTSGDSLVFNPINFASFSQNGSADITDGLLTFGINAKPGNFIEGLKVDEGGVWQMAGGGTPNTYARVSTQFFIRVVEVEGVGIDPVRINAPMIFSPSAGDYYKTIDPDGGTWTGSIDLDITAALAAKSISGRATRILVSLNNTLSTASEANTVAFIDKKDFGGTSITVIPEPSAAVVLVGGALALLRRRNRKQA